MRRILLIAACTLGCTVRLGSPSGSSTFVIGAQGGVLAPPNGLSVRIPAGALHGDTTITVSVADGPAGSLSPLLRIEPAGLALQQPATVTFPVGGSVQDAALYWSNAQGYELIPATVSAGVASAQVSRLASGYLGKGAPRRTVSGRITTAFVSEGGVQATSGGALGHLMVVSAIFMPPTWKRQPVLPTSDFSFSVPGVPDGPYWLEVDTLYGESDFSSQLFSFTTSTPDLSMVSAARPDVHVALRSPTVTLDVSNLLPWVLPAGPFTGDMLLFAGMQASVFGRPHGLRIAAAATSAHGSFDWNAMSTGSALGLPDAAKGDVEFLYQRATRPVGSGASQGVAHAAGRFARLDQLTIADGATPTVPATLADAPQTGSLRVDLRGSQWAALAAGINPTAQVSAFAPGGVSVLAVPRSLDFPQMPLPGASTSLLWVQAPNGADVDYGDVAYGQFLGGAWKEARYALYAYDVQSPTAGGAQPVSWYAEAWALEAMPATSPIAPRLGPPRAPQIEGRDAFAAQSGVGLTPTLSWSPPALGSATSYTVTISRVPVAHGLQWLAMTVHGATQVTVPPGFLESGAQYIANIGANAAPWDAADGPAFRTGLPVQYTECATAVFSP